MARWPRSPTPTTTSATPPTDDELAAQAEALYQAAQLADMLTNDLEGLDRRWYGGKRWRADVMAARDTARQLRRAAWAVTHNEPGARR